MKKYNKLTIFFVSYYSKSKIEKLIKKIDKRIKILIIDNAQENNFKNYFEKKYRNTSVIVNKINTGQTGGINTGLKKIKQNTVFIWTPISNLTPKYWIIFYYMRK